MSIFNVGFVIFPDLTQLDFTGPQQVLARLPQSAMHIVAKSAAPVPSDSGLSLLPTHTFENCPRLDLICVPGGIAGVVQAIGDQETIEFVSTTVEHIKVCDFSMYWSVCSRGRWIADGAPRNHALGLYRITALGRRHA